MADIKSNDNLHPEWICFNENVPLPPGKHFSDGLRKELENMERYRLDGDGYAWLRGRELIKMYAMRMLNMGELSSEECEQMFQRYAVSDL